MRWACILGLALLFFACDEGADNAGSGPSSAGTGASSVTSGQGGSGQGAQGGLGGGAGAAGGSGGTGAGTGAGGNPGGGMPAPGALAFYENQNGDDYAQLVELPPTFGSGAFTFEMWVRLDDTLPPGPAGGSSTANWSDADPQPPMDGSSWWFAGNFLIDGHNNSGWETGTFDLQIVGPGRVRWLFGDGAAAMHGVQAWPSASVPTLLDGVWHHIATVRRYAGNTAALELWVDGVLTGSVQGVAQVDMRQWWDTWSDFPASEPGWYFGAEKISAGGGPYWDDYKGLIGEMRFWDVARNAAALQSYQSGVVGNEPGLVGWYRLDEGMGPVACDTLAIGGCIALFPHGLADLGRRHAVAAPVLRRQHAY